MHLLRIARYLTHVPMCLNSNSIFSERIAKSPLPSVIEPFLINFGLNEKQRFFSLVRAANTYSFDFQILPQKKLVSRLCIFNVIYSFHIFDVGFVSPIKLQE